ncbi:MAG: membrane-bound lytic murein transglycosylase MltF [Gallionella sp.]
MPKIPALFKLPRHMLKYIVLLALLLVAIFQHDQERVLPDWQEGELVVIEDHNQPPAGLRFNHELAKMFAIQLHAKLTVVTADVAEAPGLLALRRAHFAAVGFRSNSPVPSLIYGPTYQTVSERLVYNDENFEPETLEDIIGFRIAVVSGSAQEAMLKDLQTTHADLHWESHIGTRVDELLDEVAAEKLDFTFANLLQFTLARNFQPNLKTASFVVAPTSQLAWAFAADSDPKLREQVQQFFSDIEKDGRLHRLVDRYYGVNDRLAPFDASAYLEQIDKTLPRYRELFEQASHWSGLEWQLIAALAYQESHWDPLATSFTNVRGMMMLTEATANQLHVKDRLDPRESTMAGARYLASIRDQLPLQIPEPDRTWMALAAYNQGYGHLEDARVLTQRMGMNANRWVDVKKWMPKLTEPQHFELLKHGYARGGEAVILVENVRMYYNMLNRVTKLAEPSYFPETPYYQLLERGKNYRLKSFSTR